MLDAGAVVLGNHVWESQMQHLRGFMLKLWPRSHINDNDSCELLERGLSWAWSYRPASVL